VQDIESSRDFIDVRDAVRAYSILAEKGEAGQLYNIANSKAISVKQVLNTICAEVSVDPSTIRTSAFDAAVPYQRASIEKISKKTGWKPVYSFQRTIQDMVDCKLKSC